MGLLEDYPRGLEHLRPLPEPLYDTEFYDSKTKFKCHDDSYRGEDSGLALMFFRRPICQRFSHYSNNRSRLKKEGHTNLNQSAMIDYPREFSLTGFSVLLNASISPEDRAEIVENGHFQFIFSGRRPYFTAPLATFPSCMKNIDEIAEACELPQKRMIALPSVDGHRRIEGQNGQPDCVGFDERVDMSLHHRSKWVVPFEIPGIEPLRIKPGEAFNAKITFERRLKLSKPARIMVVLDGYSWQPM